MSFADELRNAPENKRKKEYLQIQNDFNEIVKILVELIKKDCMMLAEGGGNSLNTSLNYYIKCLDDNYSTKTYTYNEIGNKEYEISFDNSMASGLWRNIRNKFYHYICGKRCGEDIYNYPMQMGMSKQDAINFSNSLKEELIAQGLNVKTMLKKEFERCHEEIKYIEHSTKLERIITGKKGHEEKEWIVDEVMYSFYIDISW